MPATLCAVAALELDDQKFYVHLQPMRRVDTALWRDYEPPPPFRAGGPWGWPGTIGRKHAMLSGHYVDWCITFDPEKVAEIEAMANASKMPVGDLLNELRRLERE